MKRRIYQLINLIFSKNIKNAKDHYADPTIINYYEFRKDEGLLLEERKILDIWQTDWKKVLLIGAGTGRECKAILSLVNYIYAYEPVGEMHKVAFTDPKIDYNNQLPAKNEYYDIIWVSNLLPSFLNFDERLNLYAEIKKRMTGKCLIFIRPDIMPLSWSKSFKFKLIEVYLKVRYPFSNYKRGDTLRGSLDHDVAGNSLVFYHYFQDESEFCNELVSMGLKVSKINDYFFKAQLSEPINEFYEN
jgi:hypothetical protein